MNGLTKLVIDSYRHKYEYQKSVDRLTLEIEEIETEMTGLTHHSTEMTEDQARSPLPFPSTTSPIYSNQKLLGLIEKKEEKEKQIDALTLSLQQADVVKKLCVEDQRLMQDLYHSHQRAQDVADKHGYSIKGMYKHIKMVIEKVI